MHRSTPCSRAAAGARRSTAAAAGDHSQLETTDRTSALRPAPHTRAFPIRPLGQVGLVRERDTLPAAFGVTRPAPLRANRGSSLQNDAPKCPCDGSIAKLLEKAGGPDRSVEGLACPCVAFCLAEENGSSWTRRRKDSPCRSFIWLDQSQPRCATTGRTYADTLMSGGAVHHRPLVRRTSCGLIEG
jgi:hypothetical protein